MKRRKRARGNTQKEDLIGVRETQTRTRGEEKKGKNAPKFEKEEGSQRDPRGGQENAVRF